MKGLNQKIFTWGPFSFWRRSRALRPPSWFKYQNPVNKPELPDGVSDLTIRRATIFCYPHKAWWLPKGCSVFGLDLALHSDIDGYEFKFFSELIRDFVIVMTHAPNRLLEYYQKHVTKKNVSHCICDHLKGRCKLITDRGLHHCMRHS
ncbi:hypothetical protein Hdeb2414_s0007g00250201 [Helianthus debilis subsp. tardiflorus]